MSRLLTGKITYCNKEWLPNALRCLLACSKVINACVRQEVFWPMFEATTFQFFFLSCTGCWYLLTVSFVLQLNLHLGYQKLKVSIKYVSSIAAQDVNLICSVDRMEHGHHVMGYHTSRLPSNKLCNTGYLLQELGRLNTLGSWAGSIYRLTCERSQCTAKQHSVLICCTILWLLSVCSQFRTLRRL